MQKGWIVSSISTSRPLAVQSGQSEYERTAIGKPIGRMSAIFESQSENRL